MLKDENIRAIRNTRDIKMAKKKANTKAYHY